MKQGSESEEAGSAAPETGSSRGGRTPGGGPDSPTYYDRPVLKEPVWIWAVPAYFYAGGAAGAAAGLGAAAQALGGRRLRRLVTRCRRIAAAGTSVGAVLLIIDLGRPERFLNMLRVFRPTSAMSMGSWILAASGATAVGAALFDGDNGPRGALGNAAGLAAGTAGLPLAGYTAVLLADTAVPLWESTRRSLPFLFVASAVSSATSLLALADLDDEEARVVDRLGLAAKVGEMTAMVAVERDARRVASVGRPLQEGPSGFLWKASTVATAASIVLSIVPAAARWVRRVEAAVGTVGALALRFAMFHAGKASARDPRATFDSR